MIDEAETIAKTLDIDFVELECARANAVRWKGDLDRAHVHMCRALELTRMRKEHWREVECLISLATINLERQKLPSVEQYCDEIDEIAGRLDHALPPVSAAFRVLAQFSACEQDLLPELDRALTSLRDFDDKAHLAYVLNFAAHDALALGEYSRACTAATEALMAARAMLRTTEIVVATSILARAECADGDRSAAVARLHTLVSECDFETLSARARANLERAAHDIGFALERPPTTTGRSPPRKFVTWESSMGLIIVERSFEHPPSDAEIAAVAQRMEHCKEIRSITWKRSVLSKDRRRISASLMLPMWRQ